MLQPTPSPAEPSVDPRPLPGHHGRRRRDSPVAAQPTQSPQAVPADPAGRRDLLAATVRRSAPVVDITRTLIVTTAEQVAQVRHCLPQLPIDNILVEPIGRNTAPCIGLSAQVVWPAIRRR